MQLFFRLHIIDILARPPKKVCLCQLTWPFWFGHQLNFEGATLVNLFKVTAAISLTLWLRVQALSVGVEPLETGERVSADVAINQHAASLSGDYLVHLGGHQWHEATVCGAAVCVSALQQGPGGAGGHERRQKQEHGTGRQEHFHKGMVRHAEAEDIITSPGFPSRWPAISWQHQAVWTAALWLQTSHWNRKKQTN